MPDSNFARSIFTGSNRRSVFNDFAWIRAFGANGVRPLASSLLPFNSLFD